MELAVGGEFEAIGVLEVETLKHFGLKPDSYLVDVGCGSGRLALPLSQFLTGPYLGIDIVPDLVKFARKLVKRKDWQFQIAEGLRIPEKDKCADIVCFFSVFTHLLHEHSFKYLLEAKRVLKPGGKIIFSFLDFTVRDHWEVFEWNLSSTDPGSHLNIFISKDAIHVWAERLNLIVEDIKDGSDRYVPLSTPVRFESGEVMEEFGSIGQSVAVLSVPLSL
jgi:ubiquinone/menaquinone biosynthesis C-methylase UbiE